LFVMSPWPGVRIIGTPHDRGDGSYEVEVVWAPEITAQPGVIVQQPDRPPIPGAAVRAGLRRRQGGPSREAAPERAVLLIGQAGHSGVRS
jgi:hypothetical protein